MGSNRGRRKRRQEVGSLSGGRITQDRRRVAQTVPELRKEAIRAYRRLRQEFLEQIDGCAKLDELDELRETLRAEREEVLRRLEAVEKSLRHVQEKDEQRSWFFLGMYPHSGDGMIYGHFFNEKTKADAAVRKDVLISIYKGEPPSFYIELDLDIDASLKIALAKDEIPRLREILLGSKESVQTGDEPPRDDRKDEEEEASSRGVEEEIIALLRSGEANRFNEFLQRVSCSKQTLSNHLNRMVAEGTILKVPEEKGRHHYAIPELRS